MLTRALFAIALICGSVGSAWAQDPKVLALGLADHEVTPEEVAKGEPLAPPRFNSPGVAYAFVEGLKQGDLVEIALIKGDKHLLHNAETLAADQPRFLLQAGKRGVPAGGWPEGEYHAALKVTRDGKVLIEQTSTPEAIE